MKLSTRIIGKAGLPLVAAGLIGFALSTVATPEAQQIAPAAAPPTAGPDMKTAVAALGVIEPSSEVIAVAAETPGVVREVLVKPGSEVAKGAALFRLDSRAVEASLASARASLQVAEVEARDAAARAALFVRVEDAQAVSGDARDRALFASQRAQANLGLAQAEVRRLEVDLSRLTIRAPIAGEVLRVNVRAGEYAPAGPVDTPLIAMGDTSPLHVRVEIDEEDVSRVRPGARAEASVRGDAATRIPLTFVRFEPQATPKRNLSGGAERVDTRVVQAIYAFTPKESDPVFVGQQMDVFVEAAPVTAAPGAIRAAQN